MQKENLMINGLQYTRRLGARILSEANDLKRTPAALAEELGWDRNVIERIIAGKEKSSLARRLILEMADHYPISLADLWVEVDDCKDGVKVMRADESSSASRVFSRLNGQGKVSQYYEYRDTVMSKLAPFKPEWIKELRCVTDNEANNPDVAFNKGHLMHQLTFFIGAVNFYWIAEGKKYCREMNTGDSCYITPYIPHSFTSRSRKRLGLIIAITYVGSVHGALDSLTQFNSCTMGEFAGDVRMPEQLFIARLQRLKNARSLCDEDLADNLRQSGLSHLRVKALLAGRTLPDEREALVLAKALDVRPFDISIPTICPEKQVVIKHKKSTEYRYYHRTKRPSYKIRELVRSPHKTSLCGLDIEIMRSNEGRASYFKHALHEYVYNYGGKSIYLTLKGGKKKILNSGDSAYVRPGVAHAFRGPSGAKLIVTRVPGKLTAEVFDEYASFEAAGRTRALGETSQWF